MDKKDKAKLEHAVNILESAIKRQLKGKSVSLELSYFASKMADYFKESNPSLSNDFKDKAHIFGCFSKNEEKRTHLSMDDIKCPICNNKANWVKNVGSVDYDNTISLLAECWSGDTRKDMERHLFIVKLNELPELDLTEEEDKK